VISPAIRAIKYGAFIGCSGLTDTILNNGLMEIGAYAFYGCTSLVCIVIPPAIRAIKAEAFSGCSGLLTAILNNKGVFVRCTSLVHIIIPSSIRVIKNGAFSGFSGISMMGSGRSGGMHLPKVHPSYALLFPYCHSD
jgi:hypothetical protein